MGKTKGMINKEAFDMMKEIMGDQLEYVHSGEEIVVF